MRRTDCDCWDVHKNLDLDSVTCGCSCHREQLISPRTLEEIQQDTLDKLDQTINKFQQIQELADSMKPTHPTVDPLVYIYTYKQFDEMFRFDRGNRG